MTRARNGWRPGRGTLRVREQAPLRVKSLPAWRSRWLGQAEAVFDSDLRVLRSLLTTGEISMRVSHRQVSAAVLALVVAASRVSAADFRDLLVRVPARANVLTLIDVEGLDNSALGKREGWAEKRVSQRFKGAITLPPTTTKAVLAAHLDVTT